MEAARQELLALHADDRAALFATGAAALLATQGEPLISVRDADITEITHAAALEGFTAYFPDATYAEWDDLQRQSSRSRRMAATAG